MLTTALRTTSTPGNLPKRAALCGARRDTDEMSLPRLLILLMALTILAGLIGWLMLRTTPLDEAVAAIEERGYFFVEDTGADPGLSLARATSMTSGQDRLLGPVPGLLTHDSRPTRRNDLKDQPVYLFVVDELHDPGPVMLDGPPPPERHAVFVYAQSGAVSTIAVPLED